MVRIIWSDNALTDLRNIHSYIEHDSKKYASKVVKDILDLTRKLELNPSLGRIIPEVLKQNYKELIIGNYRVMFKVISMDEILILAVFHSKRDFKIEIIEPKIKP
jgi:toxin ParE1/3/4